MNKCAALNSSAPRFDQQPAVHAGPLLHNKVPLSTRLKTQHETAVGNRLLSALGLPSCFVRYGLAHDWEPGLIYRVEGRTIGVEVTTAYCQKKQAQTGRLVKRGKLMLDPSGGSVIGHSSEPDKLITHRVQDAIHKERLKPYVGVEAVWLCIELQAGFTDMAEARALTAAINVPHKHPFERIYLASFARIRDGGGYYVFEV